MQSLYQRRLFQWGLGILLLGWLAALILFMVNGADAGTASGYEIIGGQAYPIAAAQSRVDTYNLERIGGKSAVFAVQFNDWLGSLWHGRRLAYLLAIVSSVVGLFCLWEAYQQHEDWLHQQQLETPQD